MSILPGIYASQISGHLNNNSYESIATVTVGSGGQSAITFSSISNAYKHLQIRWIARNGASANTDSFSMRYNSDSGANYSWHWIYGDGSTASAYGTGGQTSMVIECTTGSTPASTYMGAGIIDILDYANTSKNKTSRSLGGADVNGGGAIFPMSGAWYNTAAITNIVLTSNNGNFSQYSSFALYGVKG